ncbi:MAG: glutamine--fructose-6-phosphate transaminase (isomerizing) [Bacilli bacterium]|nr:glutamine--fructose-6-phosphate transaminase (isomerizing) [Bacilli bacterium]
MCGIVGYIGKEKALPRVLSGLKFLEYRGYDSAGVAYVKNGNVEIVKEVGKIVNLENKINYSEETFMGIGHTRWATHGVPSIINSHPHRVGKFTVVHNGIIENYLKIKEMLINEGVNFISETDTEVIPALLNYNYNKEKDILKTIEVTLKELEGSYAIGIICDDDLDNLYAARCGSPLIIAKDKTGNFIASDVPAILSYTNKYILLEEGEIAKISSSNVEVYNNKLDKVEKEEMIFEGSQDSAMLNGYEHYMLKEIHEEGKVFSETVNYYVDGNVFKNTMPEFKDYKNIHIVACGSAYYVGCIGKSLIEEFANIPVTVEVASEYRYKKNFYDKDTLVIIISQSGETADSLAALRKAKEDGIDTLAIVNVVGSSISREADYTMYVKAGPEIAVATTKAFLAQATLLSLLAVKLSNKLELLNEFVGVEKYIKEILDKDYKKYANVIYTHNDTFFIGRLVDYALCLEGSLKLKETSYINSVAFQAGELKHGTISLVTDGTPVIGICTDESIESKTISNIKEVKARNAFVIYITNNDIEADFYDLKIVLPKLHKLIMPIVTIIPLQLIAYEVAKLRCCDIDKPRNLAKSVTVE